MGSELEGLFATQVDADEVEADIMARMLGASRAGVDTSASASAVSQLVASTRAAIRSAKQARGTQPHALDRLRFKLQMLLELQRARAAATSGTGGTEAEGAGPDFGTVLDVGDAVRLGIATPQEAAASAGTRARPPPATAGPAVAEAESSLGPVVSGSGMGPRSAALSSPHPGEGSSTPHSQPRARQRGRPSPRAQPLARTRGPQARQSRQGTRGEGFEDDDADADDDDDGDDDDQEEVESERESDETASDGQPMWEADVRGTIRDDSERRSYARRVRMWLASGAGGADVAVGGQGRTQLWLPEEPAETLLPYQRTALRWMWLLHGQAVGGIVADEMGLGKTAQVLSFLGALRHSGAGGGKVPPKPTGGRQPQLAAGAAADGVSVASSMPSAAAHTTTAATAPQPRFKTEEQVAAAAPRLPCLVVCPATLLAHWFREATMWYAPLRVMVVHDSGWAIARHGWSVERALREARRERYDLVLMTYAGVRQHRGLLTAPGVRWQYVVLDEAHSIRNAVAEVTEVVKTLRCPHRLALTGSPVQNNLRELWSLVDFVFPGRLGDAPTFETTFAAPIAAGGWASASPAAQAMAFERAVVLRDSIRPYLLRRHKRDVATQLPAKTERVVFCPFTPLQMRCYLAYTESDEVALAAAGRRMAFKAMSVLRSICNHPWLVAGGRMTHRALASDKPAKSGAHDRWGVSGDDNGNDSASLSEGSGRAWGPRSGPLDPALQRLVTQEPGLFADAPRWWDSGKLRVLVSKMAEWKRGGHRCLVFCQGVRMLGVLEELCDAHGWTFKRMDGSTPVRRRQAMVDQFNGDPDCFAFLMTTRTGGIGLNLTGANRVAIVDPDWNPSTDAQARERSWRLGQKREVQVCRLLSKGTIEERIYQRQVFKTVMQRRVLANPDQKSRFLAGDLMDMFSIDARRVPLVPEDLPRRRTPLDAGRDDSDPDSDAGADDGGAGESGAGSSRQRHGTGAAAAGAAASPHPGSGSGSETPDDAGSTAAAEQPALAKHDSFVTELLGAAARGAGAGDEAEGRAAQLMQSAASVDVSLRREARLAARRAASMIRRPRRDGQRKSMSVAESASGQRARASTASARAVRDSSPSRGAKRARSEAEEDDGRPLPATSLVGTSYRDDSPGVLRLPLRVNTPGAVVAANLGRSAKQAAAAELLARGEQAGTQHKRARSLFAGAVAGIGELEAGTDAVLHSSSLLARLRQLHRARQPMQAAASAVSRDGSRSARISGARGGAMRGWDS